jgi:hypothetical protein
MIIRLIPRACDGLTDKSKCKELLEYCNPNDSTDMCTVKMLGHAITNPENLNDAANAAVHATKGAFHAGASTIDYVNQSAIDYAQNIADRTAEWHSHVSGVPAKVVVEGVRIGFEVIGMGISALIGG